MAVEPIYSRFIIHPTCNTLTPFIFFSLFPSLHYSLFNFKQIQISKRAQPFHYI